MFVVFNTVGNGDRKAGDVIEGEYSVVLKKKGNGQPRDEIKGLLKGLSVPVDK